MPPATKQIIILCSLLAFSACHSKQSQAPQDTKAAAPSPAAPKVVEAPLPNPPQAPSAAGLDGSWSGNSGESLPLTFKVKDNKVSDVYASYRMHKEGGCTSFASFSSDAIATVNGKSFSLQGKYEQMNDQVRFTINGNFSSDKEAAGTIHWTGKSGLCGDVDMQVNWTAKKESDSEGLSDSDEED